MSVLINPYRFASGAAQPTVAPSWVQQSVDYGSAGTSAVQLNGTTSGNLLLLFVETTTGESVPTPSGYTVVSGTPVEANGSRLTLYYKFGTGGTEAFTLGDAGDHHSATLAELSNVNGTTPFHVNANGSFTTTSVSWPAVTTTLNNCMILNVAARTADLTTFPIGTYANSNLSSLTSRIASGTSQGNGGGIGCASGILATAGNSGATTATISNSAFDDGVLLTLAVLGV